MLLGLDGWRSREKLKISILEFPDTQKLSSGSVWEAYLKVLGSLEWSRCVLDVSGMPFGCVLERLGCFLEVSWGRLGRILGEFWRVLKAFWDHLVAVLNNFLPC